MIEIRLMLSLFLDLWTEKGFSQVLANTYFYLLPKTLYVGLCFHLVIFICFGKNQSLHI
jgi:hypothetical protein